MGQIIESRAAVGARSMAPGNMRITLAAALAAATVLIGFMHAPPLEVTLGALAACGVLWWRSR